MHATQASKLVVTFKTPAKRTPAPAGDPFQDEVERFAAADPRWQNLIDMAAARLSPGARQTLGVALSGLEAGPAPRLLSFDFEPDDEDAIRRERDHMDPKLVTGIGLLTAARLGLDAREVAAVRGIVTAVHRLLRIAKTRP